jgi:hypothetical protein
LGSSLAHLIYRNEEINTASFSGYICLLRPSETGEVELNLVEEDTSRTSAVVAEMREDVVIAVAAKWERRRRAEKQVKNIVRANDECLRADGG